AQGDLAFTAVMLKAVPGDDPSTGDWRFEAFGPDGTPLSDLRPACISCHATQGANDFVFSGAQ
ncbi:MAG: cytochrome P460 family protein, partial [Burkholderiales bacterium]|nr:cytochrome P460 family protein [Anaerolineae bacterium]